MEKLLLIILSEKLFQKLTETYLEMTSKADHDSLHKAPHEHPEIVDEPHSLYSFVL